MDRSQVRSPTFIGQDGLLPKELVTGETFVTNKLDSSYELKKRPASRNKEVQFLIRALGTQISLQIMSDKAKKRDLVQFSVQKEEEMIESHRPGDVLWQPTAHPFDGVHTAAGTHLSELPSAARRGGKSNARPGTLCH